ncbi:DNA mismatch repair endonuclease MutL [Myxococcota bacterium]|nr:DNA mismatch repair endonuclease MutL [Myxococcota bacterium]
MSGDSRIRVLPDQLVDMIAAGEVVERPASIVKELVENALDAGATRVEVSVRRGGIEEISISDDGCGMTPDELKVALLRHATSKIHELTDLEDIHTFGFRGEALPSIASVSRMTVLSRTREMELGHGVAPDRESGRRELAEAMTPGTRITIANLFHNVPARLKFLKSEATEASHVQDVVVDMALAQPAVHFRLIQDGRVQSDFLPQPDRLRRAEDVLARRVRTGLYAWEETGPEGARLALVMSAPEVHLAEASGVYLFVNHRPVRDRLLLSAVTGAYGGLLPRGRYPVLVLHLELPPAMVDVNVHPQKTQVRFRSERLVAGFVRSTMQKALSAAPWVAGKGLRTYQLKSTPASQTALEPGGRPAEPGGRPAEPGGRPAESGGRPASGGTTLPVKAAITQALARNRKGGSGPASSPVRSSSPGKISAPPPPAVSGTPPVRPKASSGARSRIESLFAGAPALEATPVPELVEGVIYKEATLPAEGVRYLGCHDGLYLLFSLAGTLIVMDMHAASERVRYNEILANLRGSRRLCQGLLLPLTVEVGHSSDWEPWLAELALLGFDLDLFGERQLVIRGVPASLGTRPVEPLLAELFEGFSAGRGADEGLQVHERMAATMACHSALRKHDPITPPMALTLFHQIRTLPSGGHCPHGRPVSMEITTTELESGFLRR